MEKNFAPVGPYPESKQYLLRWGDLRVFELTFKFEIWCWSGLRLLEVLGWDEYIDFSHNRCEFSSVQFSSVTQSCLTLCDPMNRSKPGLPVHHQLPEVTQTHVHWVSDAIQPSHPLSSPSPPAPNPSQHHSLFQWVNSSHEVAKVLDFQL